MEKSLTKEQENAIMHVLEDEDIHEQVWAWFDADDRLGNGGYRKKALTELE